MEKRQDFFKSSRGVRRVNPLSPALFLVVAKFLGGGLNHLLSSNSRRCFVFGGSFVHYLAFADDIIFTMCSKKCLEDLQEFLLFY